MKIEWLDPADAMVIARVTRGVFSRKVAILRRTTVKKWSDDCECYFDSPQWVFDNTDRTCSAYVNSRLERRRSGILHAIAVESHKKKLEQEWVKEPKLPKVTVVK